MSPFFTQLLWLKMPLVTAYHHLQKPGRDGRYLPFTAVRAVGLALEEGWKASRDKGGYTAVKAADLATVRVSGKLRLLTGATWRAGTTCTLQLSRQDADLALSLVRQQRTLLADLHINIWSIDQQGAGKTTFDLQGDFSTSRDFGVKGRLWIELKVFSEATFEAEVRTCQKQLAEDLKLEKQRDSTLGGVLLLASRVGSSGRGSWSCPVLTATLLRQPSSKWQCIVGETKRKARGRCQSDKPSLGSLWEKMEWVDAQGGGKVGLLKHFLEALALAKNNPGQRAGTFNSLLRAGGCEGRLYVAQLKGRCGRKPWVAAKSTFRDLYNFL